LPDVEPVGSDRPILHRQLSSSGYRLHANYFPSWRQGVEDLDGLATQDITQVDILRRTGLGSVGKLTIAAPMHSGQADEWRSPFLMADGRHAFYVTTVTSQIPGASSLTGVVDLTNQVLVEMTVPDPEGPIVLGEEVEEMAAPFTGATDPVRMRAFLSADAYIQGALASTGRVQYDDVAIGVAGALRNGSTKAG
jgi:hypothetical protein